MASPDPRIALGSQLAAEAGLRRTEIAPVSTDDLIDDLLGRSIIVHGKGGKTRIVPLPESLDHALTIHVRDHSGEGWLFPGAVDGHISPTWIGKLINEALPKPWSLHCLRHRFATRLYQGTHDLVVVQQLLGHASVSTTQRYLALPSETLRHAVNLGAAA